ncbi:HD domain-containing protein [Psychrobacter sp. DM8]|uniref:HD domain-containing protein n=1 Tax=Psychrobacter sp. DM8 TaxID=3440636 RepID=UPI003F50AF85
MNTHKNTNLSKRFAAHLAMSGCTTPDTALILWHDIATHYSEPARAYHTLEHLTQLFSQFDKIQSQLTQPDIVALAIYYHDIIYDPKRAGNESKSAKFAQEKLSPYLDIAQCARIYALIMMTADHKIAGTENRLDAAYMLDMDLSILGAPWVEYEHYTQAVRKEYAHVTQEQYRIGRTKVLEGLLTHPKLYLTEHYHQLESQARENISREITLLAD